VNASSASNVWKSIVDEFRHPRAKDTRILIAEQVPDFREIGRKSNNARKWILELARFYGDFFATEQGADSAGNILDKKIIPHYDVKAVFQVLIH
jgi:hypothetical protein